MTGYYQKSTPKVAVFKCLSLASSWCRLQVARNTFFSIQQIFLLLWNVFVTVLAVPKLRIAWWDPCSSLICLKIDKVILNWTPRDQPEKKTHKNLFIRIKIDLIQWELTPTNSLSIVLTVKTGVNSEEKQKNRKRDGSLLQSIDVVVGKRDESLSVCSVFLHWGSEFTFRWAIRSQWMELSWSQICFVLSCGNSWKLSELWQSSTISSPLPACSLRWEACE